MEVSTIERALTAGGALAVAGCDEAGRGALAGPVVAAAVVLDYTRLPAVLMDSKRMTRRRRELAVAGIQELARAWALSRVGPREIERINILQASLKAMAGAVARLGIPAPEVLIDGNFPPKINGGARVQCIVGGDAKVACIAAASILAKVERDAVMARYAREFPQYGFERHAGYPTAEHIAALKRHGPCRLHRRTYKPVRDLLTPRLFED